MLNFIIGRACTGKTYEVVKRVASDSAFGRVVLVVPEQFTFETERSLIKFENAVQENIEVLSFSRLYDAVLQKMGRGSSFCISDFEKVILIKKALKASSDNLQVLKKFVDYNDFPQTLYDTIRDLKFAGASAELLDAAGKEIGGVCGAKICDLALIISLYDALIHDKYIDPADALSKLYDLLGNFEYFMDTKVYFDSFSGFTGQQYKIIEKILEQADEVNFSFSTDNPANMNLGLFYNINTAIEKIKRIARSRNVEIKETEIFSKHHYSSDALLSLEKIMSANENDDNYSSCRNIQIISCDNPSEEALAAANIISKEVRDNGYRFRDFILVARDTEQYINSVKKQCKKNNISCFMDESVMLTETPLFIFIKALLSASKNFSTENILKLLKLQLLEFSEDEVSELEDYIFVWNINKNFWLEEWDMSVKGLQTEDDSVEDIKKLENINRTRARIVDLIVKFNNNFVGNTKNRVKAIFNFLVHNKVDKHLSNLCDRFEEDEDFAYSSILKQGWDSTMSILDALVRVLGDSDISTDEFLDSLEIAARSCKISNVPQMLDEVTFGSADRIRPSKPKISIIMGSNQGVFPKNVIKNGILAPADKSKLDKFGISFDDDVIKGAIEENYLVYSMLCCPVDKVYILYSNFSLKNEPLEPSTFVSTILSKFDDLSVEKFQLSSDGNFVPRSLESAFSELGRFDGNSLEDVKKLFADNNDYSDRIYALFNAEKSENFNMSPDKAKALFGDNIRISATSFDTFHKCSLSYLIKTGLRARTLERADLNVMQRGTIAHYVLETIVKKYRGELSNLSASEISFEVDGLISEYFSMVKGSEILMNARFTFLLQKISSSIKQIVYHLAEEFAQSDFEPSYCELTIGEDGDIPQLVVHLEDNAKVTLSGKIDRVDRFNNNIRVVDYKTGRLEFELSDTLVGLNMQMLLYLRAFIRNGANLIEAEPSPAGILYMPAKTSLDKKSLNMNGLISRDDEVRSAMEKDNKGKFIPKYTASSTSYIDSEMFDLIFKKIDKMIYNMGTSIRDGRFAPNPTDGVKIEACKYCDFKNICRSSQSKHNKAIKYSHAQIAEILKEGE